MGCALLVIDMQNDFVKKDGTLYVPRAEEIIHPIRKLVSVASGKGIPIVFTMDWHTEKDPELIYGGWPKHCMQGAKGAEIIKELASSGVKRELIKNTQHDKFPDTNLEAFFQEKHIKRVFLVGVATEYCIKETALSALKLGFGVLIVEDAIKPINERHGAMVLEELEKRGARLVSSQEALEELNRNI